MKSVGKQLQEARLAKNWTPELAARETKIKVDETDVVHLAIGDSAIIQIAPFSDTTFAGRVTEISNSSIKTAAEAGRDVAREDAAAWGGVLILADSKEKAQELKAEHDWYWKEWFVPFNQGIANYLIGTPDEISHQIEEAHDRLGFEEVWLQFGQGHLGKDENQEELYRMATEVIPRFAKKDEEGTWV